MLTGAHKNSQIQMLFIYAMDVGLKLHLQIVKTYYTPIQTGNQIYESTQILQLGYI